MPPWVGSAGGRLLQSRRKSGQIAARLKSRPFKTQPTRFLSNKDRCRVWRSVKVVPQIWRYVIILGTNRIGLYAEIVLEMAHVLFVDIVGYSVCHGHTAQSDSAVTASYCGQRHYKRFQDKDNLIVLPTGDGAALVFFRDVEAPARCALELAGELRESGLPVRWVSPALSIA